MACLVGGNRNCLAFVAASLALGDSVGAHIVYQTRRNESTSTTARPEQRTGLLGLIGLAAEATRASELVIFFTCHAISCRKLRS